MSCKFANSDVPARSPNHPNQTTINKHFLRKIFCQIQRLGQIALEGLLKILYERPEF